MAQKVNRRKVIFYGKRSRSEGINLIASNINAEDEKIILRNSLINTGINIREFQKEMVRLKISYSEVYHGCLELETEI